MIDLHTHILPKLDDGVRDFGEARKVILNYSKRGIYSLVATPHLLQGAYDNTASKIERSRDELQRIVDEEVLNVKILTGAEVYVSGDLSQKLKEGSIPTINGGRYLLLELPMLEIPSFCEQVIFDLLVRGFTPIISHPERNRECVHNPSSLFRLVELGALIQLNAGSLLGMYGRKVKEVAKSFLSHNLIHFIASDLHSQGEDGILLKALEEASKIVGEARALELVSAAPEKIIKNERFIPCEPLPYREKSFFFWKR